MRHGCSRKVPLIRGLVRQLSRKPSYKAQELPQDRHASSISNADSTNGVSDVLAEREPRRMPYQTRTESIRVIATRIISAPQSTASRRLLKISVFVALNFAPVICPA